MFQCSVIIEQIHQQVCGIYTVYPLWYISDIIGLRLSCHCITYNNFSNRLTTE